MLLLKINAEDFLNYRNTVIKFLQRFQETALNSFCIVSLLDKFHYYPKIRGFIILDFLWRQHS